MDLLTLLREGIASEDSLKTMSKKSHASTDQVSAVLMSAIPALMAGMQKNSESEEGAFQLDKALDDHAQTDVSDINSFLDQVDTEDGMKILNHILGNDRETERVEKNLAARTGADKDQVAGILSMAAPLLMSYLGKEKQKSKQKTSGDSKDALMSMLGSMLSGGSGDSGLDIGSLIQFATRDSDNDGKSDLGSMLSGLLGGR
ncbi:MAG: DUF937 domain-containing protein, partial [Eubacteriales bacterium]|nr:DUF937 domain-containing protein [Eubacteriales bacterium]